MNQQAAPKPNVPNAPRALKFYATPVLLTLGAVRDVTATGSQVSMEGSSGPRPNMA